MDKAMDHKTVLGDKNCRKSNDWWWGMYIRHTMSTIILSTVAIFTAVERSDIHGNSILTGDIPNHYLFSVLMMP